MKGGNPICFHITPFQIHPHQLMAVAIPQCLTDGYHPFITKPYPGKLHHMKALKMM